MVWPHLPNTQPPFIDDFKISIYSRQYGLNYPFSNFVIRGWIKLDIVYFYSLLYVGESFKRIVSFKGYYFEIICAILQTENYNVKHLKLRGHYQYFFHAFNAICCTVNTREKSQALCHGLKLIFVARNMAKCRCNTATKSNLFDFAVILQQQKYFSGTKYSKIQHDPWSATYI